jgi:hypothetical protein
MAWIAVELPRMGQRDWAERSSLDSPARIHGEDFGFSEMSSIVEVLIAMKRAEPPRPPL